MAPRLFSFVTDDVFKIVRDQQYPTKAQYLVYIDDIFHSHHGDIITALKTAEAKDMLNFPYNVMIVKQHYYNAKWYSVSHWIPDHRRAKLKSLKGVRRVLVEGELSAIDKEIAEIEKEIQE